MNTSITLDSVISPTSSVTGEEYHEFISELVSGASSFRPGTTKYVCHTSTIPLATVVDHHSLKIRMKDSFVKEYHGDSRRHVGDYCCNPKFCIYNSAKYEREGFLLKNCPCQEVLDGNEQFTPICFLSFLKTLNHNLIKSDKTINPKEVMFCLDSENIFNNKYSKLLKDATGVSGWGHVGPNSLHRVLNLMYWFRKYSSKYKLWKLIESNMTGYFPRLIAALKQSLHTTNNLIVKKFTSFGPEIVQYGDLAEQTARIFRDLFSEYIAFTRSDIIAEAQPAIYEEAKDFFNLVKKTHGDSRFEVRKGFLTYNFKNRALGSFFGTELRRCAQYIDRKLSTENADYTTSLAWDLRCTTLCQTRTLGYLPYYLVREKSAEFKQIVTQPVMAVPKDRLEIIRKTVYDELKLSNIKFGLLRYFPEEYKDLIKKSVSLEVKYTASASHTVSEGGKPEDARSYLDVIRRNKIAIPIRDLDTFEITGFTPILGANAMDDEGGINISSILFWFSLQMSLNFLIRRRMWPSDLGHYFFFRDTEGKEIHEDKLLDCKLIVINEPGKARMLVKSMSMLNWVLIPASKISQKVLAEIPEHRAGLELGSHDWHHTKRISGESPESRFMYDSARGRLHKNIIMGFMDWTEATDRMKKMIGIAHLQGFWGYIQFPEKYGQLVMALIRLPQLVSEEILVAHPDEEPSILKWTGTINEGFMMGNQMTKTILHLSHLSQRNIVEKYLNSKGIEVRRTPKEAKLRRSVARIDRSIESSVLNTHTDKPYK